MELLNDSDPADPITQVLRAIRGRGIPGIETGAPERNDTSNGIHRRSAGSPVRASPAIWMPIPASHKH